MAWLRAGLPVQLYTALQSLPVVAVVAVVRRVSNHDYIEPYDIHNAIRMRHGVPTGQVA
jgi:hypothetical protein